MSGITPGERRELRSVVKQQFKVLRTEVEQREVELQAEAERMILDRYRAQDVAMSEAQRFLQDKMRELFLEMRAYCETVNEREGTNLSVVNDRYSGIGIAATDERTQERRTLVAGVKEQVKTASLGLDRQEADLLRSIATDALETEEARGWLGKIPTVAELVPSRRLREIEAQFDSDSAS